MKKTVSLWLLSLLALGLAGCWNTVEVINSEENTWVDLSPEVIENTELEGIEVVDSTDVMAVMSYYIETNLSCDYSSDMFVNIAPLWKKVIDGRYTDYYVLARGEGYVINSRWDLTSKCWFSVPMRLNVAETDWTYAVNDYELAKDWSDYDASIKAMFSEEAIEKLNKEDYEFYDKRSTLEMAEDTLGIKIIPDEKKIYSCSFCDKLWYYEENKDEDKESSELVFNYVAKDNWKNTIFFGSDWKFEAAGSWDAWEWTWTFWNNGNSVIVSDSNNENVYSRYVITNVDDEHLNTVLEIIQRK